MSEISITEQGNPAKPHGEAGELMLECMSESHKDVTEWALSRMNVAGNEKILDIGCGGGAALKKVSALITSGHLTGADYSEVSVELSRKNNITDVNCGKMDIVQASVNDLPFSDNSFDIIYTIESFYFWGNDENCLQEVRRVLAPDGIFMIVADIFGDANLTAEEIENVKKYNLFNPTTSGYRNLLENAGFTDIEIYKNAGTSWICVQAKKNKNFLKNFSKNT